MDKMKENKEKNDDTKYTVDQCLIHINFCIVLMRRVNDEHNELFDSTKVFQFHDNNVVEFNSGDDEEDEYHTYIFDQLTQHKKEAIQHWMKFEKLWKVLDDEEILNCVMYLNNKCYTKRQ